MEPLSPGVERRIERMWAADEDRRLVREALAEYGRERHHVERERVHLAILKLSGGDVNLARSMARAARGDFRDVLAWAEYPEEIRAPVAVLLDPSAADLARMEDVRRRDRAQYEAWLRATDS